MDRADETAALLERARRGDRTALGDLLDRYRGWLKLLAQRQLGNRLVRRLDASDIVQQTCLSVYQKLEQFQGGDVGEFVTWLQRVLERNVQEAIRNHTRIQKRSLAREEFVGEADLPNRARDDLQGTSPSQRAMRGEDAVRLAQGLQTLPESQREAVRLRYLEGWSLAEICEELERSPTAVAGLLKRGMKGLRAFFDDK